MVQVPAETRVTVVDETVQTPVVALVNATVRLLDAVALTVKVPVPMVLFDRAPKVMLWLALPIEIVKLDVVAVALA